MTTWKSPPCIFPGCEREARANVDTCHYHRWVRVSASYLGEGSAHRRPEGVEE